MVSSIDESSDDVAAFLVSHCIKTFDLFRSQYHVPNTYYSLDEHRLVFCVTNAVSDRDRAAAYSSSSGPSSHKTAAFVGKWLAHGRPVRTSRSMPINQVNAQLLTVNSDFAVYCLQGLIAERMYPKLFADLRYCFEFRSLRGEEVNLLLEHALVWSPKHHGNR